MDTAGLLDRVSISGACWEWTGARFTNGYGAVNVGAGRKRGAHRVVYEALVGPIPAGMTLDHECHNGSECTGGPECTHRRCVNPDHLSVKSRRENTLAAASTASGRNTRKTHCKHGHEFTKENTYVWPRRGWRVCRKCQGVRRHAKQEA